MDAKDFAAMLKSGNVGLRFWSRTTSASMADIALKQSLR
jgi:hypothetical protein